MWIPAQLQKLIEAFKKLPGIGERSSSRIVFYLLRNRDVMDELTDALASATELKFCSVCHTITDVDPCPICSDPMRANGTICVVEHPEDVFTLERIGAFKGRYHVIGGVISPLDGIKPEDLHLQDLVERIKNEHVEEVLIALSPTVEGDITAHYIADMLKPIGVRVTRIARGLPTGSDLSLADETTLREAIEKRVPLS